MHKKRYSKPFLRLAKNKGSVLFFIVAIMTVLVVVASAAYYAVTSASQKVEVTYGNEQTYQTSLALNDIVTDFIKTKGEDPLVDAIIGLEENKSLETKGVGTEEFTEITSGLGNYKVTITKLKGGPDAESHLVQIQTEVEIDGEISVVTTVGEITTTTNSFSFDRFFTSTGYAPNDVVMSGMTVTSSLYLDNEYSMIGSAQGGNSGINIEAEVICAGTLSINNAPFNATGAKTFDITVGNNLYTTYTGGQGTLNLNGGTVRVGGNMIQGRSFNLANDTDLYVVGDYISGRPSNSADCEIYINGDAAIFDNGTYAGPVYINGDLFIDKDVNTGNSFPGGLKVGGNIYLCSNAGAIANQRAMFATLGLSDKVKEYSDSSISFVVNTQELIYNKLRANMDKIVEMTGNTKGYGDVWPTENYSCESLPNVKTKINEKLGNAEYSNWDMSEKFEKEDGTFYYDPINFNFNGTAKPQDTDPRFQNSGSTPQRMIIRYEDFKEAENICRLIIGDIRITNGDWNGYNIMFDTEGDDGKAHDMYVYLPANCKMTDNTGDAWRGLFKYSTAAADKDDFNCFRWNNQPEYKFDGWFTVTVKGRGSVIFVVQPGTTYMAQERLMMCHYNLISKVKPGAIQGNGYITDTIFQANDVASIINEKNIFKQNVIDSYRGSGYLHNNIFLVAVDKNSRVNFDAQYNTFCGFLYAPYMTFGAGKTGEGHFAMLGGLIVSDYEMPQTSRVFMATVPYDYYDRFTDPTITDPDKKDKARRTYMENIMKASGGKIETLKPIGSRSWRKYGYN